MDSNSLNETNTPTNFLQQYQQDGQQDIPQMAVDPLTLPPHPFRRDRHSKEERSEREDRYNRIENLTIELSHAVRDEMARRKDMWDVEGNRDEEEFWEGRKQQVYTKLEVLAEDIQRAVRDRQKESVMNLWSKESEQRDIMSAADMGVGRRESSR
jgi:hypothetical protein